MTQTFGFAPNHDEAARQAFVGSLKKYVNFDVESALAPVFERASAAAPPKTRAQAAAVLEPHPLYRLWASLTFHSQNMMWDAVQRTTDRSIEGQVAAFAALASAPDRRGSMALSDQLLVKAPVVAVCILLALLRDLVLLAKFVSSGAEPVQLFARAELQRLKSLFCEL